LLGSRIAGMCVPSITPKAPYNKDFLKIRFGHVMSHFA
jgi:hypothetical protein